MARQPGVDPAKRRKARRLAVQALYQWQMSGNSLSSIETEFREDHDMAKVDEDYFVELLHKIPTVNADLEELLTPVLDRDAEELNPVEDAVLKVGAYELKERIDVPHPVIISEAVALAKIFGASEGYKYVNAVLDNLAKQLRPSE